MITSRWTRGLWISLQYSCTEASLTPGFIFLCLPCCVPLSKREFPRGTGAGSEGGCTRLYCPEPGAQQGTRRRLFWVLPEGGSPLVIGHRRVCALGGPSPRVWSVTGSSMGLSPLPRFHSCPEHEKQNAFTTGPVLLLPAATHDASTSFPPWVPGGSGECKFPAPPRIDQT